MIMPDSSEEIAQKKAEAKQRLQEAYDAETMSAQKAAQATKAAAAVDAAADKETSAQETAKKWDTFKHTAHEMAQPTKGYDTWQSAMGQIVQLGMEFTQAAHASLGTPDFPVAALGVTAASLTGKALWEEIGRAH